MIRYGLLALFLAFSQALFSQEATEDTPPLSQRMFYGGSFGFQFGKITFVQIDPVAGLWLLPRLNVAAGPSFKYYNDEFGHATIFGGRAYSEFVFLKDLDNLIPMGVHLGFFVHAEYEGLSLERSVFAYDGGSGRVYQGTLLGGAGLSEPVGANSSADLEFLWVISGDRYQLHDVPEFRVMLTF